MTLVEAAVLVGQPEPWKIQVQVHSLSLSLSLSLWHGSTVLLSDQLHQGVPVQWWGVLDLQSYGGFNDVADWCTSPLMFEKTLFHQHLKCALLIFRLTLG